MWNGRTLAGALMVSSFALIAALGHATVKLENTIGNEFLAAADEAADGEQRICNYKDTSAGMGGQSGKCKFTCAYPGTLSLSITAGDKDAYVSGDASCNSQVQLSCTGNKECSKSGRTNVAGAGQCQGSSSETWDSGLTVSCESNPVTEPGQGPGLPPKEYCPVSIEPSPPYPRICVTRPGGEEENSMLSASTEKRLPLDMCSIRDADTDEVICLDAEFNATRLRDLNDHILATFHATANVPAGHIFAKAGLVVGLVCLGYDCVQVEADVSVGAAGESTRFQI